MIDDLEFSILGALLVKPDSIFDLHLTEKDFIDQARGKVFSTIRQQIARGEQCDEYAIRRLIPECGDVITKAETSINGQSIRTLAVDIMEESRKRRLKLLAATILSGGPTERLISEVDSAIDELRGTGSSGYVKIGSLVPEYSTSIQEAISGKKGYSGAPTGLKALDRIINGFSNGELIIIGARPSVGKTAIALNIQLNQALIGLGSGLFSMEMKRPVVMNRYISAFSGVDSTKIKMGMLNSTMLEKIKAGLKRLEEMPIWINDTPRMDIDTLLADARRMVKRDKAKVIYVDYIGLLRHENPRLERHLQVSNFSARLKGLAEELEIPIVVLSQLTRDTDGKAPSLANLRDSGSIEQDADMVILMHKKEEFEDNRIIQIDVAKNRNGPIGKVEMRFIPRITKFEDLED